MTFPKDMEERCYCSNGSVNQFTELESLFVFVQTVHCHIHSKDIGELGCTFVDCPGLFASAYDTSIALKTIAESGAVLYLLDGNKQIGQGDKKAIRTIYENSKIGKSDYTGDNIFFAINQRKSLDQTSFINLDLAKIDEIGFKKEVLPLFNAILFYYAKFGMAYLDGTIDTYTVNRFMASSTKQYDSIETKWVADVKRLLFNLELDCDITELSYTTASQLLEISKSYELFSEISDYVVKNKAYSILFDEGAVKILDGLKAVEKVLENEERLARMDVAARAEEVKKAREALEQFCKRVIQIVGNSFPIKDQKFYIERVYNRYFLNQELVDKIAFGVTKSLQIKP